MRQTLLLLIACLTLSHPVRGDDAIDVFRLLCWPRLTSAEQRLLDEVQGGRLPPRSFLPASLRFGADEFQSPLNDDEIRRLESECERQIRQCRDSLAGLQPANDEARAAFVFAYLHRHLLTGDYAADAYQVARTLQTGDYNCLSATILFQLFCEACDIPVRGRSEPAHVCCELAGARPLRIEMTLPDWQEATRQTNGASFADGRQVNSVHLLAKLFFNRSVQLQTRTAAYPTALAAAWMAVCLDPQDDAARQNLAACLNNWALVECEHGHLGLAEELLSAGLRWRPSQLEFSHNLSYLHRCYLPGPAG